MKGEMYALEGDMEMVIGSPASKNAGAGNREAVQHLM